MKTVRIGAGQGFYGDTIAPAIEIAKKGNVDYICFDCLAELTMAILVKDQKKNPRDGFTKDITLTMKALLPYVKEKGIKLLTNAGGMNPQAAGMEVMRVAKELGLQGLKVAVVTGDNVIDHLTEWEQLGLSLDDLETKQEFSQVSDRLLFANAYLGARPIAQALHEGADIVVTGRTTDTAQFLAPLLYEFGWGEEEWDKLASGVFMGHLLECSGQATGGNFSGAWWEVEGFERIGYPIAEVSEDGEFTVSKVEGSGGLVSIDTIKEQMLYEIHDPSAYITPDVVVDLLGVTLEETAINQVKVRGVRGKPRPDTWKVVMGYENGYVGQIMVGFSWPHALQKARKVDEIIRKQLESLRWSYYEVRTDFLGYNSLHGPLATLPQVDDLNEIYLRMAVRAKTKDEAARFGRLFPPLALNGPPTMSGFTGMQPPRELIGMWSSLIPREVIEPHITVTVMEVEIDG